MMATKNVIALQANKTDFPISPKGTNIVGYYRKCGEVKCFRLIPCPHVRCQDHRTDMAIQDWIVEHAESSGAKSFKRNDGE